MTRPPQPIGALSMTILANSNSIPAPQPRLAGIVATAVLLTLSALSACSNLSGLGGSAEFGCKAPVGVPCMSVSGVNANERAGNLPSQRAASNAINPTDASAPSSPSSRPALVPVSDTAAGGFTPPLGALRSDPTVIRIWIPPWEDADGDLVDQSYVYLQIDSGRWLIEHNREAIRKTFAPKPASTVAAVPAGMQVSAPTSQPKPASQPLPSIATAPTNGSSK